jgi:hypothetical protein
MKGIGIPIEKEMYEKKEDRSCMRKFDRSKAKPHDKKINIENKKICL